jgi:serine-type D-Ala-D-Ala carboxypeptidase/endopeptidase
MIRIRSCYFVIALLLAIMFSLGSSDSKSTFSKSFSTTHNSTITTAKNMDINTLKNNTVSLPPPPSSSITDLFASNSSTEQKEGDNSTLKFEISPDIKAAIKDVVDGNNSNAAIVIGLIDPNGTQFYGYGKLSNASNKTVDENTIFSIGSTTKVFTTVLLADLVNKGLVNLNDPIEKYLPSNVNVPQFNGHKITVEDLATHTSGLPEFPDNYCSSFDPTKTFVQGSVNYRTNVFNCTKDYSFEQFYEALSNFTLTREPGSKVEYSTFGIGLLGHILVLKSNMS